MNAVYEAVVTLALRGPVGHDREVDAVIDTGFNGYLTLPPAMVKELGLPFRFHSSSTLADGSEVAFDVYGVTVMWDGEARFVDGDEVAATPSHLSKMVLSTVDAGPPYLTEPRPYSPGIPRAPLPTWRDKRSALC